MTSAESFDSNAIEVNGIRFETLVPDPVVILPKSWFKQFLHLLQFWPRSPSSQLSSVPIKLGLSITNNTSQAIRFNFYPTPPTMLPQIVGADGREIKLLNRGCFHPLSPSDSDFPSVMQGETVTFFLKAEILWWRSDRFVMSIAGTDGLFWRFEYLKPGNYQIRFKYHNQGKTKKSFDQNFKEVKFISGFWTGEFNTPWKEFYLVSS